MLCFAEEAPLPARIEETAPLAVGSLEAEACDVRIRARVQRILRRRMCRARGSRTVAS